MTQDPDNSEPSKGSKITFTCTALGSPLPDKLKFSSATTELKSFVASTPDADIGATTFSISYIHEISSLDLEDTSSYICEGKNTVESVEKTNTGTKSITVMSDVVVEITISKGTPGIGDYVTISCKATGGKIYIFIFQLLNCHAVNNTMLTNS